MHNQTATITKPQEDVAVKSDELRVLIAAGGTGGHVYPAIAIADALKDMQANITVKFVGTDDRMEAEAVPAAGYDFVSIWISGFHRRLTAKNLLFPFKLIVSMVQSLRITSTFDPDAAICCGGFVTGPIGWVAGKMGVPLFLQEQNSYPGVTNRLLAKQAELIFTAFEDADAHLPEHKTRTIGNPTRQSLTDVETSAAYQHFGLNPEKRTLLILGGSGGARMINRAIQKNIEVLHDQLDLQIIWQCGKAYYKELDAAFQVDAYEHLHLFDYLYDMPDAYAVADLVVSRAGALSCSELALTQNASILVPSPNVAGDHQTSNAASMADNGAAVILKDDQVVGKLPEFVEQYIFDEPKLMQMQQAAGAMARPDAAKDIAAEILQTI